MSLPSHTPRAALYPILLGALAFGAYLGWLVVGGPESLVAPSDWAYNAAIALAGVACLGRATRHSTLRGAWIAFGSGLLLWATADVYWVEAFRNAEQPPYPSLADAGFVGSLLLLLGGVILLARHRVRGFGRTQALDVAVGALATLALAMAALAPVLVGATEGATDAVLVNLAYPIGDLFLLQVLVGVLVVGGLRGGGPLVVLSLGLLLWLGADIHYLYQEATTGYVEGWPDALWPAGALLIGLAACMPAPLKTSASQGYSTALAYPVVFTALAAGILVWDHFNPLYPVAVVLAALTLLGVAARLVVSLHENHRLLSRLRREAVTDSLTGLGNRRLLTDDLERILDDGRAGEHVFAMFDLDGFKSYNDAFGHPAGDAMLAQLGASLSDAVDSDGRAYRLGSDEFGVLAEVGAKGPSWVVEKARASLNVHGGGFAITASGGWTKLPGRFADPSGVLREADHKLFEEKARRSGRTEHTTEILTMALREREPSLGPHTDDVQERAVAVGRMMGIDPAELDVLAQAAELHDIGKIGIPDDILQKPALLDVQERELMERHPIIGERILATSPSLRAVSKIVRSSHERWDGKGYPDGLTREEIPLAARIIFVCDAFSAMTRDRSYRAAMGAREALDELERNAGTQFDPEVVLRFRELIEGELGVGAVSPRKGGSLAAS